jgi:hypothetical protein
MRVHFFSGHYLLYVSDLHRITELDRPRVHIIQRMNVKAQTTAIIVVGWGHDSPIL